MTTINRKNRVAGCSGSRGFSLVELLVVVAILGALAAAVGVYINTADAKLKSFAFNLGSRFKLAKFEAIKRGRDVYLDFNFDGDTAVDNGYTIWVDNDDDAAYDAWDPATDDANANDICDQDEGDCLIGDPVDFSPSPSPGPVIYDGTAAGGPAAGPNGKPIGDGVSIAGAGNVNRFRFSPGGDASNGTAYIYYPSGETGSVYVAAGPWAIIVNNVGRIRLDEWREETGWRVDE